MSGDDRTYTTAETADLCGISKSTLYRWERESKLPPPSRDLRGRRQYGKEDLVRIAQFALTEPVRERIAQINRQAGEPEDEPARKLLGELHEDYSLDKFVVLGDRTGLDELRERENLKSTTILRLLEEALRYEPEEEVFKEIVKISFDHVGEPR